MSLDLDPIRRRAGSYQRAVENGHPLAFAAGQASAEDVPALLAEVDRLRAELATSRAQPRTGKSLCPACGIKHEPALHYDGGPR